jgi:hypothetical protein
MGEHRPVELILTRVVSGTMLDYTCVCGTVLQYHITYDESHYLTGYAPTGASRVSRRHCLVTAGCYILDAYPGAIGGYSTSARRFLEEGRLI